ncbi:serine hydrolase domain-containing protein [Dyella tabacisoli]
MSCIASAAATSHPPDVDAVFADIKPNAPGCAVGVQRAGELLYTKGYGAADLQSHAAITPMKRFYIGSTTKQFTAAIAAMLIQQNVLSPGMSVRHYLPDMPVFMADVTIDDLIHHTSGIRDYTALSELAGRDIATQSDDAIIAQAKHQLGLDFTPGTQFSYSSTNYVLLARILERTSGLSLDQLLAARIFTPLGMTKTLLWTDLKHPPTGMARGYVPLEDNGFKPLRFDALARGGTGMVTTVGDLLRWEETLQHASNPPWPTLRKQMLTKGKLRSGESIPYGYGIELETWHGAPVEQHGGSFEGWKAQLLYLPHEDLTVALLCNDGGAKQSMMARKVAQLFMPHETSHSQQIRPQQTTSQESLYAGVYVSANRRAMRVIQFDDAHLRMLDASSSGVLLDPVGTGYRTQGGAEIHFVRTGNGYDLVESMNHTRQAFLPLLAPARVNPLGYTGLFRSTELAADFRFRAVADKLVLEHPAWGRVPLSTEGEDAYGAKGYLFLFERNRTGQITTMRVTGGGLWMMVFKRQGE